MAKGFDPKWSMTTLFCAMRGIDGLGVFVGDKGGQLTVHGSVAISRACPDFPGGAAYFGNPAVIQALYPTAQSFGYMEQAVEIEFYPTSFGYSGRRYLCTVINRFELYFDVELAKLQLDFWPDGSTLQSHHAAVDLASLVGKASKAILRISLTHLSVELNGAVLFNNAHGVTTFSNTSGSVFLIGNSGAGSVSRNWYGYIGPVRRTVGDLRAEETSATRGTMYPLGALDTYREKVVFHSHCEPTGGPIEDTCGNTVSFYGNAEISTDYKAFGSASFRPRTGGASVDFDTVLGAQDFEFETFALILTNSVNRGWCFALLDSGGAVALGLTTKRDTGGGETVVIVNGVSHTVASGVSSSMQYMSLVRAGNTMTLFINGASVLSIDVTGVSIANVGPLYLGKPASVVETVTESIYLDETRLTVGQARHNASSTSVTIPTERFNEYGPHSMRGTVKRMVSGSAVISPGSLVAAFDRTTLRLVSRDVSAADGSFELPSAHGDEHFVLAFDDDMNLVGYDKILPAIFS